MLFKKWWIGGGAVNESKSCTDSKDCNEGLVCRYVLENGGNVSKEKQCQSKLESGKGPCVNSENDCIDSKHKCIISNKEGENWKVCDELRKEGKCESDSDCARGYDCKDSSCIENCKSDNDCPDNEKNCVNVGSNSICQAGNDGDFCNNDNHCKENFWCRKSGAYYICKTKLKNDEQCDRGRQCEGGICENGKCK